MSLVHLHFCVLSIVIALLPIGITHAQSLSENITNDKAVILNFDDGRKSQFTYAKPILDKYDFKATFYIVCNYIENKPGFMDWKEVKQLYNEGHDIGSHGMNHRDLSNLTKKEIKFELANSKECLKDHGIDVTSFAYPFNKGSNDKGVIKILSKYYDLGRTASDPLAFLHCDGNSRQTDCSTYSKDGKVNYANKYSIWGWSHDLKRKTNSYNDEALFDKFVEVVNSQSDYNRKGSIEAIPIIIYHRAGDTDPQAVNYNTGLELLEKEMRYLHDNNFQVITMRDLGYEEKSNYIYIKQSGAEINSGKIASIDPNYP